MTNKTHATLRYTSMRISLFLAVFLVVWLLAYLQVLPLKGASGALFVLIIAAVVSAPLSYVLLSRQRDAMSEQITGGVRTAKRRFAESAAQEDDVDDAIRRTAH